MMENSSEKHITPTLPHSNNESPQRSDEMPSDQPKKTPSQAVIDFDGNLQVVRANYVLRPCANKQCLTFSAHCAALLVAMICGLVMMIVRGSSSADFGLWSGIFTLGVGGFLPAPTFKDAATNIGTSAASDVNAVV